MSRIYLYKLTNDDGGAPCVAGGMLTLSICKPRIRSTARIGDLLIGVAANSLHADNRLIYVARITDKKTDGEYYKELWYRNRRDCIYDARGSRFVERRGALHHGHPGDLEHDLGPSPGYPRANTLLSQDYRYFNGKGSDEYKTLFPRVARLVATLGRGHRVNHGPALEQELTRMIEWSLASDAPDNSGSVRDEKRRGTCNSGSATKSRNAKSVVDE